MRRLWMPGMRRLWMSLLLVPVIAGAVTWAEAAVGTAAAMTGTSSKDIHRRRIPGIHRRRIPDLRTRSGAYLVAPLAARYPNIRSGYHESPGPTYLDLIAARDAGLSAGLSLRR